MLSIATADNTFRLTYHYLQLQGHIDFTFTSSAISPDISKLKTEIP
jgi:hypothetical protein